LKPKPLAIAEACLIGVVAALASVLLKQSVALLEGWRAALTERWPAALILPGVGLLGGYLSGWLIERLAPEASGSGIPQVKAALAYVPIALSLRVALVKLGSTILSLGAGLPLGRQGPTVQIGASLAAQLSRWIKTSPAYHRQLVAAGAAAGLAAGFNAPIAGVLFVVEELLQDVSDFTLGTAILASFVGGVVSRLLGGAGLLPSLAPWQTRFWLGDIPGLLLVGLAAGILGGLFCRGILSSLALYRDCTRNWRSPWRIALAGGVTGAALLLFSPELRDSSALPGILVSSSLDHSAVAVVFLVEFLLILLAYGSGAPGGLFAPSLVLGSALGSLMGRLAQALVQLQVWPGDWAVSSPTLFALAGMGAFFSAVTRGPITAIVIVFEITANFELVLPLMIGSVVAYLVAEKVFPGSIYRHLLEWRGIHLETTAPADQRWQNLTAADLMQRRVETLESQISLDDAVLAFGRSHHRGFPVLEEGRLVGILSQTDLTKATAQGLPGKTSISQVMTQRLVMVSPSDSLAHVLHVLNQFQVSRLPVIEGRTLVGIITRADIIRAQSETVTGEVMPMGPQPTPSYVVYQRRSPALGQGRLLVVLNQLETADTLLRFATAIARAWNYELECLQVIEVPPYRLPAETPVDSLPQRQLLDRALQLGHSWGLSVHCQIRVAHEPSQAILDTIKERHIRLALLDWVDNTNPLTSRFSDGLDITLQEAPCDVVLVKAGSQLRLSTTDKALTPAASAEVLLRLTQLKRWLLPVEDTPHTRYALDLLPTFVSPCRDPEVSLCQVYPPSDEYQDTAILRASATLLQQTLQQPVKTLMLCSSSVADALVDLAQNEQCDVIVLGASQEGRIQQALKGSIPGAIARQSTCTLIMVHKAP
jgi:CIC family chloride channel protein